MLRRLVVSTVACLPFVAAVPAAATGVPEPSSVVAIGDSITRATNAVGWYGDHPSLSWSTGFNPIDGFDTHYERLLGADRSIWGNEFNVARSGARMSDAPTQASRAVATGAEYVTFLMGANDVCARDVASMTPVPQFANAFDRALSTLAAGLPDARILVASIPDLQRLATVYRDDPIAEVVWHEAEVCPTVLDPSLTPLERLEVRLREHAFNLVLAGVCARYPTCRFDGFAVNAYAFDRDEVSRLDYFHPSLEGQQALAALTWSRSWWSS